MISINSLVIAIIFHLDNSIHNSFCFLHIIITIQAIIFIHLETIIIDINYLINFALNILILKRVIFVIIIENFIIFIHIINHTIIIINLK